MARPSSSEPREPGPASRPRHLSAPAVDAGDWPAQAADTIERVVQNVRDKTTGPAMDAARWLVAGPFLFIAGMAALILLIITLVRFLNVYLPDAVFGDHHIWAAYGILGALITLAGWLVFRRRSTPADHS